MHDTKVNRETLIGNQAWLPSFVLRAVRQPGGTEQVYAHNRPCVRKLPMLRTVTRISNTGPGVDQDRPPWVPSRGQHRVCDPDANRASDWAARQRDKQQGSS
ncbi:hypothetical protein MAPG_05521 [Magnaporthiopsis poae ATCC 64411]|uniref:Uncharacterized protein n=1 Tax=Magnaporthiopsis poae (strain ATCC 64411 / 73-15) TaxID=644358 RepID=A0A0C4DZL6_MAGP6|nr:hypothetical protein MAPG_05521 [Magnaporthiopsis poae ATCC 64411]